MFPSLTRRRKRSSITLGGGTQKPRMRGIEQATAERERLQSPKRTDTPESTTRNRQFHARHRQLYAVRARKRVATVEIHSGRPRSRNLCQGIRNRLKGLRPGGSGVEELRGSRLSLLRLRVKLVTSAVETLRPDLGSSRTQVPSVPVTC